MDGPGCRPPPRHLDELRVRAEALAGRSVGEIARALGLAVGGPRARTKGLVGDAVQRALGASAGARAQPDFPHLGVELKTVPVDERGRARESTFVTSIRLGEAADATWATSAVRAKLAHVLWVPVEAAAGLAPDERRIGVPLFWRPTEAQSAVLRADFDDLIGLIGAGGIESLTARDGRWLQVRPKAASGRVRTLAPDFDGDAVSTVPRGFYLRRIVTSALLASAPLP
jgi:DNA mismatch repair protein MutH